MNSILICKLTLDTYNKKNSDYKGNMAHKV